MNIQRLQAAHARGAGIEIFDQSSPQKWLPIDYPGWYYWHQYRIKESDKHLEYGPVANKLRDTGIHCQNVDIGMFTLFMAEYVADAGI